MFFNQKSKRCILSSCIWYDTTHRYARLDRRARYGGIKWGKTFFQLPPSSDAFGHRLFKRIRKRSNEKYSCHFSFHFFSQGQNFFKSSQESPPLLLFSTFLANFFWPETFLVSSKVTVSKNTSDQLILTLTKLRLKLCRVAGWFKSRNQQPRKLCCVFPPGTTVSTDAIKLGSRVRLI